MIPRDHAHRATEAGEDIRYPLDQNAIHPVVLERIARHQDALGPGGASRLDDASRRGKPFITDTRPRLADMRSLHPDLPVCRVEEPHAMILLAVSGL
jgi:hypothetical protein